MRIFLLMLSLAIPASGASWYLSDVSSGSGTGGSWANACAITNFNFSSSLSAGDTVYIDGGAAGGSKVYTRSTLNVDTYNMFYCSKAGSAGNPITITIDTADSSHNGRAVFNFANNGARADVFRISSYNKVDGGPLTNIWVINNTNMVNRDYGAGFYASGGTGATITHCGVSNVNNGISGGSGVNEFTVSSNQVIYNVGDVCIGASPNMSATGWDKIVVYNNIIQAIRDNGGLHGADGIKGSPGLTASNNVMYCDMGTAIPYDGQHPDAFQTAGAANWTKIINNTIHGFHNATWEIGWGQNVSNIVIMGNVTHYSNTQISQSYIGAWVSEGWLIQSIRDVYVINNTAVDHTGGNVWFGFAWDKNRDGSGNPIYMPTVTNLVVANNLTFNCSRIDTPVISFGGDYLNTSFAHSNTLNLICDYNLIAAGGGGGTNIQVGPAAGTHYTFYQAHPVVGNPTFTSYSGTNRNDNFRLQSGSVGLSQGTNFAAMLAALTTTIPLIDMDGNPWPSAASGLAWNVGAYATNGAAEALPSGAGRNSRIRGVKLR